MSVSLRCPSCRATLEIAPLTAGDVEPTCRGCGRTFPVYNGVVDLRGDRPPTCWSGALVEPEPELARKMSVGFSESQLSDLVDVYAEAHALAAPVIRRIREYCVHAAEREDWTITYMDFSVRRYGGGPLRGSLALDAGTGSGGAIPHLAERFDFVVGLDPDLPALLIAAKRCLDLGIGNRVVLVAGLLEQDLWHANAFDAIKCTDVIEHVEEPRQCARVIASALSSGGTAFILTPNKWSLFNPEPHVRLWGVQFLPGFLADAWVRRRFGMRYRDVAQLFSSRQLSRTLACSDGVRVEPIPIEDKHLNPSSPRGRALKSAFSHPPLCWASRLARPIQPTLEALLVRQ